MSIAGPSRLPGVSTPSLARVRASRPPIPADLARNLSRIRSDIFLTIHNPESLRLGTKYIRRPLRGPAMLKYYPLTLVPSLQKINKFTPTNPYANWQSVAGHMLPKDANGKDIQWASEQYPYDPNTWPKEVRHLFDSTGTPRRPGKRLIPPLAASGLQRIDRGDKMMEHPLEERRQKRVARRRRLGKGPPRKGAGRGKQVSK